MSAPGARLRILFLLEHSEHLGKFEAAVAALAGRHHQVVLGYPKQAQPRATTVATRLAERFPNVTLTDVPLPTRPRGLVRISYTAKVLQDTVRHLSPQYRQFDVVRIAAMRRYPGPLRGPMTRFCENVPRGARLLSAIVHQFEKRLPINAAAREFLRAHPSDVVLATPLVTTHTLVDYLRLAKAAGVPTILPVASWDNLTTKGILHVIPDGLIVWNERQQEEAVTEFGIPADRIAVTGAHTFDRWFEARLSPREEFCRRVGLPASRPFVLYLGSSKRIAQQESKFVGEWLQALRKHSDAAIRDLGVLIRPHFNNPGSWEGWRPPVGDAVVSPPLGEDPVTEESRQAFVDALGHCVAVIGANTTAMMEAGIFGRPVLSIVRPEFGQESMPHFHHLVDNGLLMTARSLPEHFTQLAQVLADPDITATGRRLFMERLIRPHGAGRPAASFFADAVESLARRGPDRG